jgi:hypothetical protein
MHRCGLVCFLDAINFVNALLVGSELDRLEIHFVLLDLA